MRATWNDGCERLALKRTRGRKTATNTERRQTRSPQKLRKTVPALAAADRPALAIASRASIGVVPTHDEPET